MGDLRNLRAVQQVGIVWKRRAVIPCIRKVGDCRSNAVHERDLDYLHE